MRREEAAAGNGHRPAPDTETRDMTAYVHNLNSRDPAPVRSAPAVTPASAAASAAASADAVQPIQTSVHPHTRSRIPGRGDRPTPRSTRSQCR